MQPHATAFKWLNLICVGGKFFQGFYRAVNTNVSCKGGTAQGKKYRHTGNCVVHLDIEGDGDYDLLGGNISFSDVQLLFNNANDFIIDQDTLYQKKWPHD
jgi:hypothetical protein